jgi:hypothetical protein
MKPWFEKELAEADIIKFPIPQAKVVQMPNVQEYPDFITGVQDLQAKQKDGAISQESYDKLYAELIHRFMKKESFETPWFIREAPGDPGIMGLPQAGALKDQVEKAIAGLDLSDEDNIDLLRKMYNVLKSSGIEARMTTIFSKDIEQPNDNQGNVLKAMGRAFLGLANQEPDQANEFLNQFEKNPNVVNTEYLLGNPGNPGTTSQLFVGEFAQKFGLALMDVRGEKLKSAGYAGPGEVALASLSNQIQLGGTFGDITINKKGYEVKGNEGRLFDKGNPGNGFKNAYKFLGPKMRSPGNLSVEDLASIDPELQDIVPKSDTGVDEPKHFKGKAGDVTSDQAVWSNKDEKWWKGFMGALMTDWFGGGWGKSMRDELVQKMGQGGAFKLLWLQLQFSTYQRESKHNGVILIGQKNFVYATKGEHLKNNIKSWGTALAQNPEQSRELSIQLRI